MKSLKLKPLLKYPGGKTSELDVINQYLPRDMNNYIEPFVGGGAVYFNLKHKKNYIVVICRIDVVIRCSSGSYGLE